MLGVFLEQLQPELDTEAVNALESGSVRRRFAAREFVYSQGDSADGIFIVCHGCVILEWQAPHDFVAGFRVAGHGEWFGLRSFCGEEPRSTRARAVTETLTLHLSAGTLQQAARVDPHIYQSFARMVACDVGPQTSKVARNGRIPLPSRLAFVLVELAGRLQVRCLENGVLVHFPLTQKDLANLLDVSHEAVSRTLRDFELRELVRLERRPRRLVIADYEGLVQLAGNHPADDELVQGVS